MVCQIKIADIFSPPPTSHILHNHSANGRLPSLEHMAPDIHQELGGAGCQHHEQVSSDIASWSFCEPQVDLRAASSLSCGTGLHAWLFHTASFTNLCSVWMAKSVVMTLFHCVSGTLCWELVPLQSRCCCLQLTDVGALTALTAPLKGLGMCLVEASFGRSPKWSLQHLHPCSLGGQSRPPDGLHSPHSPTVWWDLSSLPSWYLYLGWVSKNSDSNQDVQIALFIF